MKLLKGFFKKKETKKRPESSEKSEEDIIKERMKGLGYFD